MSGPSVPDAGSGSGRPGRHRASWAAVVALVVALLALSVPLLRGDGGPERAAPLAAAPESTWPGAPPSPPLEGDPVAMGVDRSDAVWPWPGADTGYADPVEAARGFATGFVGFTDPVVAAFRRGDSRSGEVDVRPTASGPATTVLVRRLSGEDTWSVVGASTPDVVLAAPRAGDAVSSPVTLRGSARAFEGTVQVQVRQDGTREPLGAAFVTGGGDQLRPFMGEVSFAAPSAARGALVLHTVSEEDGRVWQATVVRVQLRSRSATPAPCGGPAPPPPQVADGVMVVSAFFTCDPRSTGEPSPFQVHRAVPASAGVLRASLTALLAGPTDDERAAGISSFFSGATSGLLRGVSLADGHAVVDLGDLRTVIPNASTSAGSAVLLSELDATVFQFPTVTTAEYRLEGSCTAFTEWLQAGGCAPRTRP